MLFLASETKGESVIMHVVSLLCHCSLIFLTHSS